MKNISIKNFEKAKRIHKEILAIDYQIIQIEKIANEITFDESKIWIGIEIEKHETIKEVEMIPGEGLYSFFGRAFHPIPEPKKSNSEFSFSDSECLKVLDTILKVKYYTREKLIKQLEELGVTI